uniref:Uncharacterized protein n=1 Tax=Arundo donax TaxID=35708 RepID=A0A0A9G2X5_ARUDO
MFFSPWLLPHLFT